MAAQLTPAQERAEMLEAKATTLRLLERMDQEPTVEDAVAFFVAPKHKPKFDCQSVLSLRSNLTNHPGRLATRPVATQPRLKPATRMGRIPEETEDRGNPWDTIGRLGTTARASDESAEERKARKAAVKETQREAREQKKEQMDTIKLKAREKAARFVGNGDVPQGVAKRKL